MACGNTSIRVGSFATRKTHRISTAQFSPRRLANICSARPYRVAALAFVQIDLAQIGKRPTR